MTLYDHSDTVPSRKRRTGYMNGWMDEHLANKISIQGNVLERVNPSFTTLLQYTTQGRSQDFSKGGSQTGTPSGYRRLYMVYTAALPRVSAGSVVLSRHEGPY